MKIPDWFGKTYPTIEDFEKMIEDNNALLRWTRAKVAGFRAETKTEAAWLAVHPWGGPLRRIWKLAHEVGHLVQHAGPGGKLLWSKDESEANAWAAQALIPIDRIYYHQNACEDVFIGALSAHYEDIPFQDCPVRRLARKIAIIRLECMRHKNHTQVLHHIERLADDDRIQSYTLNLRS